jgi:uncharacterized protein (TIGR03000 family)
MGESHRASAQVLSKWGHPVFSIGLTPYDSISQGHGNYPGGPGFIPGYGYYPGSGPSRYPWLDGPDTPFDRRGIGTKPVDSAAGSGPSTPEGLGSPPPGAAVVIVKVPAEAELWIDEHRTSQGGSYRVFVTPRLAADSKAAYLIRARWLIKDAELSRVERVTVAPGATITANFLTAESWTGKWLERMPHPRADPESQP